MAERNTSRIEKLRDMSKAELETQQARARRADFPSALSAFNRAVRRLEKAAGSKARFRASENVVARKRIEEGVMANESGSSDEPAGAEARGAAGTHRRRHQH